MPPKAKVKSKTPPLNKNNRKRVNTLAMSRIKTKSGNQLCIPSEIISLIAKQLKNLEREKYYELRKYNYGYDYFYNNYCKIMKRVEKEAWHRAQGIYGTVTAVPFEWGSKNFRQAVALERIYIMFPKLSISKKVKDATIRRNVHISTHNIDTREQIIFLTDILEYNIKRDLDNDYAKLDGFLDALFEELQAEVKQHEEEWMLSYRTNKNRSYLKI